MVDRALGMQDVAISTRRDQMTIMVDIMGVMKEPQRLTHVLYRSNMSYSQLIKYLNELKAMGMIEEHKEPFRSFKITSKGKLFREMLLGNKGD